MQKDNQNTYDQLYAAEYIQEYIQMFHTVKFKKKNEDRKKETTLNKTSELYFSPVNACQSMPMNESVSERRQWSGP